MKSCMYTVISKHDLHDNVFSAECHEFCSETQTEAMAKFLSKYPLKSTNFFVNYEIINLFELKIS